MFGEKQNNPPPLITITIFPYYDVGLIGTNNIVKNIYPILFWNSLLIFTFATPCSEAFHGLNTFAVNFSCFHTNPKNWLPLYDSLEKKVSLPSHYIDEIYLNVLHCSVYKREKILLFPLSYTLQIFSTPWSIFKKIIKSLFFIEINILSQNFHARRRYIFIEQ